MYLNAIRCESVTLTTTVCSNKHPCSLSSIFPLQNISNVMLYQVVGVCEEELKVAQRWNGPGILNLIRTIPMYDQLLTVVIVLMPLTCCNSVNVLNLIRTIPMYDTLLSILTAGCINDS